MQKYTLASKIYLPKFRFEETELELFKYIFALYHVCFPLSYDHSLLLLIFYHTTCKMQVRIITSVIN